jgi:flagellar basal body-associated protein FliL
MKDKKKLIAVILALVVVGAGYKFAFAGASDADARIHGQVYVLPKEFLVNLADGRFAKVTVALVLPSDEKIEAEKGTTPPEGFGPLPQEGAVRAVVTDEMTDASADDLIDKTGRARLCKRLLRSVKHETDVKATKVLFTDMAVQ